MLGEKLAMTPEQLLGNVQPCARTVERRLRKGKPRRRFAVVELDEQIPFGNGRPLLEVDAGDDAVDLRPDVRAGGGLYRCDGAQRDVDVAPFGARSLDDERGRLACGAGCGAFPGAARHGGPKHREHGQGSGDRTHRRHRTPAAVCPAARGPAAYSA